MNTSLKNALELANYDGPRIVTVGLVSGTKILTGKRRDNNLWTSPGGHADEGEDILSAGVREVKEEAGIDITPDQLEFIGSELGESKRVTGKKFALFAFLAHIDKEKASAKNDPDKEISEWKWVELSKNTPELAVEARHAFEDAILIHLGIHQKGARLKSRTMKEVSKDIQTANFDESGHSQAEKKEPPKPGENVVNQPEQPKLPEPGPKTPADMKNDPEAYLPDDEVTPETSEKGFKQTYGI